ncbi:uncharacterized protein ASPGLDRAFT_43115 [Aspergillus glaucus CBS 516.65]|uniref:Uncharacterized protein n=1 Tax=Aspergillus glaucus CBS 516.65 TaxID=1160497 RepID=A0A1L9VVT4_ASPGL|nr:hypothetical protein ASPGLDRAFT_43115 [Aspergillus glaucus CBS 516.65]OJJ88022.1 hypothetical protein ASPGLDRAFT_43115 [Aspergillus glaucus CBS 516.65]
MRKEEEEGCAISVDETYIPCFQHVRGIHVTRPSHSAIPSVHSHCTNSLRSGDVCLWRWLTKLYHHSGTIVNCTDRCKE